MKFFSPPFDFDRIDRVLRDDFSRFGGCAYVLIGMPGQWELALENFIEIETAYREADRDDKHLWQLFDLLVDHCRGRQQHYDRLHKMADRMGFYLPKRLQIALAESRLSFEERKRRADKAWLAEYQAKLDRDRASRGSPMTQNRS